MNRALQRSAALAICSLWIALAVICAVGRLAAQAREASVSGLVIGPAGEPVAGAHVVAVQNDSGVQRETVSSAAGQFLLVDMAPGSWQFRVVANGLLISEPAKLYLVPAVGQTLDLK
ncbi:MAG: carboxypeptidase-like regulatory domain-containing protein, partial [Terracidiphilus sp.]